MSLFPNKKQWNKWSLPSKLTAIGTLIGIISLGCYFLEKTFNIIDWAMQDDTTTVVQPEISVALQFPYERVENSVKQNKRNPELTITNRGSKTISPIKADVTMFVLNAAFDEVNSAALMNYETHGHFIFEPELKPGLTVSASLPGIKNWYQPVAYRVSIDVFFQDAQKIPNLSLLYLVDDQGIKAEGAKLSKPIVDKLKSAIDKFEKSSDKKKKLRLSAPVDGVWVPSGVQGAKIKLNEDGTLTVK